MRSARPRCLLAATLALVFMSGFAAGTADAAVTIGSDLSGTPASGCEIPPNAFLCTITQLTPSAGDPYSLTAPSSGVITQIRLKHGPAGLTGNSVGFRILAATGSTDTFSARIASPTGTQGTFGTSGSAAVDTFGFKDGRDCPTGVSIHAGERLGVYMGSPDLPVVSATGSGAGELANENHYQGQQTYQSRAGELLVQATIEPDANGDGYGDESQRPDCGESPPANIDVYTAPTIDAYTAPTIKKFPSHAPIRRIVSKGFRGRVSCGGPCSALQQVWLTQINWLVFNAYASSSRRIPIAKRSTRLSAAGEAQLVDRLNSKAKRFLRHAPFKRVKVVAKTTVTDSKGRHVRSQRITLTR